MYPSTAASLKQDFLDANDGNVFFAAAALGISLSAKDPNDPLKLPYSAGSAARVAANIFGIDDKLESLTLAIEVVLRNHESPR